MQKPTCSIDGCGNDRLARGWCNTHYKRWRRHGNPLTKKPHLTDSERFWNQVNKTETCWNWTEREFPNDYAQFKIKGRSYRAHRVSYEWAFGPIPRGLQIDHMCHNRICVRPDHLRVVTNKQNQENRTGAQSNSKSGIRGVSLEKRSGKWLAIVVHRGKRHSAGRFDDVLQAESAVVAKRLELFTHNLLDRSAP